jgi:dihydroxyacetone kinase phosphoprotein-dependent L subunit
MDEPLSSLDAKLRAELRLELKRIQHELGATILYVTHDQTEAMTLANRIGVLKQGSLVQVGSPRDIYDNPADIYVATRLGSPRINLLPRSAFPDLPAPADAAKIGARTEHLRIRKATNGSAAGTVKWIEHLGDQNHLHVAIGERELVTLADVDAGLAVGDAVTVEFSRPMFFGPDGARIAGEGVAQLRSKSMDQAVQRKLISAVAEAIIAHADELTALDREIGDGDHGLNMKRGFEAVLANIDVLAGKPLPDALKAIGAELVMKVGGASGPLYGTLLMALGKAISPDPTLEDVDRCFGTAIDAVKARGKSDVGQKTMLDVLAPARAELANGSKDVAARVAAAVERAAEATKPMRAARGRASFLGERSIGHVDPGARSSALMIMTVCRVLGG